MANPTRTTDFSNLLAPGLRKIFFDDLAERPLEYSQIANMTTTQRNFEDDYQMAGLPTMPTKPQGTAITYEDPISGATKRYTPVSFGLGFRVTQEMWDDDLYGQIKKMPKELAMSARHAQEVNWWAVLNNAFSTTLTFDGLALAHTAHTLLGGGTYANRPSTDADLSITSLQAAIDSFEGMINERGMPRAITPTRLVIPYQTKWIAREILGSSQKPYTANNEINPLMDEDLKYFVSHFLTDTDSWFLLSEKAYHSLTFMWRTNPKFDNADDFDTGDAKFKAFMRFAVGVSDWRGVYGTTGA